MGGVPAGHTAISRAREYARLKPSEQRRCNDPKPGSWRKAHGAGDGLREGDFAFSVSPMPGRFQVIKQRGCGIVHTVRVECWNKEPWWNQSSFEDVLVFKLRCVTRSLAVKLMSAKAKRQGARAENRKGPQSTIARICEYEESRIGVDVPDRFRAMAKR